MRRLVLVIVLSTAFLSPATAKQDISKSVRPVQVMFEGKPFNICTAWATHINGLLRWVTAAHCTNLKNEDGSSAQLYVDNKKVDVERRSTDVDIAVLVNGPKADGLDFSHFTPKVRTKIYTIGYPFGSTEQYVSDGTIAVVSDQYGFEVWALPIGGGNSGGPVLDSSNDRVVGIVQQQGCEQEGPSFCPVGRGATAEQIAEYLNAKIVPTVSFR
jgi:Trypsin-like peptidase domain